MDLSTYKLPAKASSPVRSERDELIRKFLHHGIQLRDRQSKELRTANITEIAKLLIWCPTKDLYPFFKECENARSFSKFFWWAIKGRRPKLKS